MTFRMAPQQTNSGLSTAETAAAEQPDIPVTFTAGMPGTYCAPLLSAVGEVLTSLQAETETDVAANATSRTAGVPAVETTEHLNAGALST